MIAPGTNQPLTKVEKEKEDSKNTKDEKKDGGLVKFARFCEENPGTATVGVGLTMAGTAAGVGLTAVGAVVAGPALGVLALSAAGFTAGGIAAGEML